MRVQPTTTLAATAALILSAPAPAQQTISRAELATTDPAVMHQKIRDLLWEMVELRDFREEALGKGQLSPPSLTGLTLQTKVMPAATRGLCRRQTISIRLGPDPGSDQARGVRATALYTHTQFHFFQPPEGSYNSSWYRYAPNPECEKLPPNANFFHADNELSAHDGYLYFLQAQAAARAGTLKIECDEIIRDTYKTDCRDDVLKLEQHRIDSIAGCAEIKAEDCISVIDLVNSRRIEVQMGGSPWRPVRLHVGFFASVTTAGS